MPLLPEELPSLCAVAESGLKVSGLSRDRRKLRENAEEGLKKKSQK